MSELIAELPQAHSQSVGSGLDRLSKDPAFIFGEHKPQEEKPAEEPIAAQVEKLEAQTTDPVIKDPQTVVDSQKPDDKVQTTTPEATQTEPVKEDVGFSDNTQQEVEGTWRSLIEAVGYTIPEEFDENKGFDAFVALKEAEVAAKTEQIRAYKESDIFSSLPENVRGEGQLVYELLKSGQTLDQINAPIQHIKELKSLSKEQLIRKNLEGIQDYTQEMIDHRMEQLTAAGHIDVEYQILVNEINRWEQNIVHDQKQQIQHYYVQQAKIKDQQRQQEFNSFRAALDRVPVFMDRKLSTENKTTIVSEFNNGYVQNLINDPEKLVKFMLYDKYGEQGLKILQDRATERATVEKSKSQHNIPVTSTGSGPANMVEQTTQFKSGLDRLTSDPRYQA